MFYRPIAALAFAVVCLAGFSPAVHTAALPMIDEKRGVLTIAPILESVTPGVVNISVLSRVPSQENPLLNDPFFRRFFGAPDQPRQRQAMSAGSGVIVDAKRGYVLTNHHVVAEADQIIVTLKDRRQLKARLVGSDPETDIALLEVEAENLTQVAFGDSDGVRVGDVVVAIGNPFGIGQTVTSGIVSAVGRRGLGLEGYEDFIQTDASINPGNSGGALINSKGELIGINTAIIGPGGGNVGIGFAVPSNMASAVMAQLARYGEVRRGRLGVAIQDLTQEIAEALSLRATDGAIITNVEEGSPAAQKGLRAGDVVVAVDGHAVRNANDLRNRVGLVPKGETVQLDIFRDGKPLRLTLEVGLASVKELPGDRALPQFAGALFRDIPSDSPLAKRLKGVLVARVDAGSPAWRYGLREGDAIVALNRRPIESLDEFFDSVKKADRVIAMNVVRGDGEYFVVIQR